MWHFPVITWLAHLTPAAWPVAIAAAFVLPVRLVVVITGAAVACTTVAAVRSVHDDCIDRMTEALLSARPTRPAGR